MLLNNATTAIFKVNVFKRDKVVTLKWPKKLKHRKPIEQNKINLSLLAIFLNLQAAGAEVPTTKRRELSRD